MSKQAIHHPKFHFFSLTCTLIAGIVFSLVMFAFPSHMLAQTPPDLVSVEPATVSNDTANVVMLSGTGFVDAALVSVGSEPIADVTWMSAEQVQMVLPQGFAAGVYDVTITNPDALSDTLEAALTVQNPAPVIEAVTPGSTLNDVDTSLVITGSGFIAPVTVRVGAETLADVTWVSAEQVEAVLPQGFTAGVYDVTITNPDMLSDTLEAALTVQNPAPVIEAVSPSSVPNDIDNQLVITGSAFVAPLAVQVGGQALAETTVVSATQAEAVLPWGWDPGVYDLQVTNPGPGSPSATMTEALSVTQAFGVWTTGGPYGGDAILVYAHPEDENLVFASMRDVGLFRSADGGANWQKVFPESPFVFAVAPSDHRLIYQSWVILHKSTDGGLTWQMIYNPESPLLMGEAKAFLVHPTDPMKLYAGIPKLNTVNSGFFYSPDGGVTWERKESGMTHNSVAGAVFHPDDPEHIFVVSEDGYLYETTDSAEHWNELSRPFDRFTYLAIDPFNEHELWAGTCADEYDGVKGVAKASLLSLNTWQSIPILESTGWCYNTDVTFDPVNSGTIYVSTHTAGYKTTDGGESWYERLSDNQQLLGFALSAADPETVYARHWGKGIKRSNDGGMSWETVNNGLAGVVPTALAAAADNPDEVYAGGNPYGLYWSDTGGHGWLELDENAGSVSLASDAFTPGRVYSAVYNGIRISTDHGQSWVSADYNPTPPGWCNICVGGWGGMSVGSHPGIPGRVLAGIGFNFSSTEYVGWPGGIAISTDYGATWNAAQTPEPCGAVLEFAFSASDPNWMYANGYGYQDVQLLRSQDGGFTWEDITPDFSFTGHTIAVHPADPRMVFIASYEAIYRSTDGGETWTNLAPVEGTWSMLYTNSLPPVLYAGGSGLMKSYDHGLTWQRAAGELGYARVRKLAFSQDGERAVLYVGTAGVFGAETAAGVNAEDGEAAAGVYRSAQRVYAFRWYLPFTKK